MRRAALVLLVGALAAVGFTSIAWARVHAVHKSVTIHIKDNTFDPSGLDIEEGTKHPQRRATSSS